MTKQFLSQRILNMEPSATIAMNQRSRDLQAKGVDVINLSVGEPDFYTPDHIKVAAKKAIDENFSFYPPVAGYPDLRKAVVEKFKRDNNLDYTIDNICVSVGAKHAIANVLLCLLNDGDEVIIPAPYWVSYAELVKIAGGKNVIINGKFEHNFKVKASDIEAAISPKTKALLLCSPSNPTGAAYTRDELEAIAKVIAKHDNIFIISDEIYEHINFVGEHCSIAQIDFIKDRSIVVNGVSKAYAMTGYRIGFIGAPAWIVKAVIDLQGQFTSGTTTIAQKAAVTALLGDQQCVKEMGKAFKRRRDLMVELIRQIPGIKVNIPEGAFYVFPDVTSYYGKSDGEKVIRTSNDLCLYLLEKGHIAVVPGEAFGDGNCIRISYATADEKLTEAMRRMKEALAKLK